MSYRQKINTRDENEPEIVEALTKGGASVERVDFVDLLIGFQGVDYLGEVKNPNTRYGKNGLNKNQLEFEENWNGGKIYIFYTAEDVALFLNEKRGTK
jgi:hypothetical protein